MFSFFKRKCSAVEVADAIFDSIKRRYESDQAFKGNADWQLFRGDSSLDEEIVKDEWLYFEIYLNDLATFLAFGNTPKKQTVLDRFVCNINSWLKNRPAPSILDERISFWPDPANPLIFPPENAEPAVKRLNRRIMMYAETKKVEKEQGKFNMTVHVFSTLCGVSNNIACLGGINAYLTSHNIEAVKFLTKYQIV
jgi:hypothetical protein